MTSLYKSISRCFVVVLSLTTVAVNAIEVSPNDKRDYAALTLKNDLTVILVSDPSIEKSAASLSVGVGLLSDPMSQQGMAHYLEHMLFLGTERFPDPEEYNQFMAQNGGSSNAYTWMDITNYMFEINNDAFDNALDRFSDFFKKPKLYPKYTEKEINAVNAEWSMRREMDFFGQFKLSRDLFGDHPAHRFLIGNLETLGDKEGSKLHPQTVEFFNKYYSANIMKVALISNLPIAEMKKLAKKHFNSIENKNIEKPVVTKKIDFSKVGNKKVNFVPNKDVKQLELDFTIDNNMADYKYKPNYFLEHLLGSEMPNTPAAILKQKGWISSLTASASENDYGNYGKFAITLELTDQGMKKRPEITATILEYIELIRKKGPDSKYFDEIQTSLDNRFRFLEKSNSFNYVSMLTGRMQNYPAEHVISAPFKFEEFNKKYIKQALSQLTRDRLRVWYISKDEPSDSEMHFYNGKYKVSQLTNADVKAPAELIAQLKLPKQNTLLPTAFDIKAQIANSTTPAKVMDKDGIAVWHLPSAKFKSQPKGLAKIILNSPELLSKKESQVLMSIWTDLFALQNSELLEEARIAGMNLSVAHNNGLEVTMSGFTDKQDELLTTALQKLKVDVDKQTFAQAIERYTKDIANKQKDFVIYQAFDQLRKLLNKNSVSDDKLVATANKLTLKDLNNFMTALLEANSVRIFTFGNYDDKDRQLIVKSVQTTLPENRKVVDYKAKQFLAPIAGKTIAMKQDVTAADVSIIDMAFHPNADIKERAKARILRSHFRTATFNKLRTEEQLAYAVTAIEREIGDYSAVALAIQTPVKNAKDMQDRFDKFKVEYQEQLNNLTAEEFAQLQNSALIALQEEPKNLSEEVGPMISDWYKENWKFDTRASMIAAVKAVTLDDVKAYYQDTMMNNKAAKLNLQLRGSKFQDASFAELNEEVEVSDINTFHSTAKFQD